VMILLYRSMMGDVVAGQLGLDNKQGFVTLQVLTSFRLYSPCTGPGKECLDIKFRNLYSYTR